MEEREKKKKKEEPFSVTIVFLPRYLKRLDKFKAKVLQLSKATERGETENVWQLGKLEKNPLFKDSFFYEHKQSRNLRDPNFPLGL